MMFSRDDFPAFYAALHGGNSPFAWQLRLLDAVLDDGRWPDRIVAPTGAGKTVVIDVHVFAVALMAIGAGPRVPRRLGLVVDRRALVDSQVHLAREMARAVEGAEDGILAAVRDALRSLRSSRDLARRPLRVVMLRGGVEPSRRWVDDPTEAVIICATPAMWGSRLLFRGYGTGRLARPREAGLFAYDSVVVVDEAHLARQLVATARRIDALEAMAIEPPDVPRLQVVEATATAHVEPGLRAISVHPSDLEQGARGAVALAARLSAPKPVTLVPAADWPAAGKAARASLARLLADEAAGLLADHGRTVACVVNTVGVALAVANELRRRGLVVELLVGRMRPHDIAALRRRRPSLLTVKGDPEVDVIVATQTVEVGIDADFSAMVTELAPGSALAQRAGRVNRLGLRTSTEVHVVVPVSGAVSRDAPPYRADELSTSLAWIGQRAASECGLAPIHLADDPPPPAVLRRLVLGRPEPWDALYLARTSDELFAEPDLELLLADDLEVDTDVSLVVRYCPAGDSAAELSLLRATPPRAAECFPVAIGTLRKLLTDGADRWPTERTAYRWRAEEFGRLDDTLRPGDVVVVGDDVAWFTHGVVDAEGAETAADVLEDTNDPQSGSFVLRIAPGMPIDELAHGPLSATLLDAIADVIAQYPGDGRARRDALAAALDSTADRLVHAGHDGARRRLATAATALRRRLADTAVNLAPMVDGRPPSWIVITDQRRLLADEEIRQTWTGSEIPVGLDEHQAAVADRAQEIGRRVGLRDEMIAALQRAGVMHDEGKRDPRFQRLLRGPSGDDIDDAMLAKSGRRTPAEFRAAKASCGLPTGWRHEQLSAALAHAEAGLPMVDTERLVVRLVGTSHGHGRSTFPHGAADLLDGTAPAVQASADLYDVGAWDETVEETHRQHGVWGCAYLEAILRAADGQVSGEANG